MCYVPKSFQTPPSQALPPDMATHQRYLRELESYLFHVAKNPETFQMRVEKRREELLVADPYLESPL